MTEQTKREVVKARAYGKTVAEIVDVMGVSEEEVKGIDQKEVTKEREYLRSMGYLS